MKERFYKNYRLVWIDEMLHIYGFINREHVMRKFGLSKPQAAKDFADFQRLYPGVMRYDLSAKRYVPTIRRRNP